MLSYCLLYIFASADFSKSSSFKCPSSIKSLTSFSYCRFRFYSFSFSLHRHHRLSQDHILLLNHLLSYLLCTNRKSKFLLHAPYTFRINTQLLHVVLMFQSQGLYLETLPCLFLKSSKV